MFTRRCLDSVSAEGLVKCFTYPGNSCFLRQAPADPGYGFVLILEIESFLEIVFFSVTVC